MVDGTALHGTSVPAAGLTALAVLEDAGHESWLVGGFVRDALLGQPCADLDVATAAPWQQTVTVFERAGFRVHPTGAAHGTVTVLVDDAAIEVTTFRADGTYEDGRHPTSVTFVSSIEEDLARRDFTMNALAFHPQRGLLDPYGGAADLAQGTIRTVGEPKQRFSEDALRILRACRFVSQLGFAIEPATYQGMLANKGFLGKVSVERTLHELDRLVMGPHPHAALMGTVDVLAAVLPELMAAKGFDQHTPYHMYDVLEHTAYALENTPPTRLVRWTALFHDLGKPAAFFTDENGTGHFYGHARISVEIARGIMRRLKFSPAFAEQVLTLVRSHDDVVEPTPRAVKRMLARLGGSPELFRALCAMKRGDALAQAPQCRERVTTVNQLEAALDEILAAEDAFSLKQLALSGRDIMALGAPQGPLVGAALDAALEAVIDERVPNEREALEGFAREWLAQQTTAKRP